MLRLTFQNYPLSGQTIYFCEWWEGNPKSSGMTMGVTVDEFISKYCTVQSDYAGCGEVLGKGKVLKGCTCDEDSAHCPGVKATKTRKGQDQVSNNRRRIVCFQQTSSKKVYIVFPPMLTMINILKRVYGLIIYFRIIIICK